MDKIANKLINIFGLKLDELPSFPNPDKMIEIIMVIGMEKIRKQEREQIIKDIDKLLSPSNHPMLLMVKDIINKQLK